MSEPVRLAAGDPAPALDLTDDSGTVHTWKSHAGQRVVLYVYPAAMTPGCTTQACDFRDSLDSLAAAGITVLGVSPDKPEKLARFRDKEGLTFPLLSDPDKSLLEALGAFGEKKLYGKTVVGVIRSTFVVVVDARGRATIERAMYAVKATGHVQRLRQELGVA
jgi:peroxiredoxin Q/BCP